MKLFILTGLVEPGVGLIFWTTIVFLLLLFILGKYAWKPILKAIKEREESITNALSSADKALNDMRELKSANEIILTQARTERDAMLKEARETKEAIVAEAKQRAQAEYNRILVTAREQITNEKNAAVAELKNQVAVLSIEIAEKILKSELSNDEKQKALVSNLMKDVNLNYMIAATRYAKSLMDLAVESNQLEAVRKDMKAIEEVCKSNHDFVLFLKSPVIKTDKKQQVIKSLFEGKISQLSLSFLNLITSKHRESYVSEIASAFDEQYKANKNIFTAVVTSAKGLDASSREKVMELLRSQMKGEVELVEKVNPDTIGGFILKIGDRQIDRTVARQLSSLKKELTTKGLN